MLPVKRIADIADRTIEKCLYILVFCLPFSKSIVEICFSISFIAWVFRKVMLYKYDVRKYLPRMPLTNIVLIYFLVLIISLAFSSYPTISAGALFTKTAEYILIFFFITETINTKERLRRLMVVLTASFFLVCVDASWQYITGKDFLRGFTLYSVTNRRLRACFSGSIGFAAWLSGVGPVVVGYLLSLRKKIFNLIGSCSAVLCVLFLVSTYSRAAVVSMACTLIFFAPFIFKSARQAEIKIKTSVTALLVFMMIGATFFVFTYPPKRNICHIFSLEDVSTKNRVELWKQSFTMIKDRPLYGWGLNTYSKIVDDYKTFDKGWYYPHNSYLHMMIEVGTIGTVAFLMVLIKWFNLMIANLKKHNDILLLAIGISALAFLLQSLFDAHLYSINLVVLLWIILGTGVTAMSDK